VQRTIQPGSRGIAILTSRYQAATSGDIAGWKRLSVILKSVEIAEVLVICSYDL
jgi:hypothetical protein